MARRPDGLQCEISYESQPGEQRETGIGMFIITKEFHFSASHVLDRLPTWHPCARLHGHNYIVVLELSADDDARTESGFVRDYRDLDAFKKWIDSTLDHRHLNEAMGGGCLSIG